MCYDETTCEYPRRGEVYYIDSYVSVGRAMSPKQGRPAVIISRNERNRGSGTVQIVYLTHSEGVNQRNPVLENADYNKVRGSVVVCGQIHTVDKNLIGDFITRVHDEDMKIIEKGILNSLFINPENHCDLMVDTSIQPCTLENEDSIYKRMYYELIDHLRGE